MAAGSDRHFSSFQPETSTLSASPSPSLSPGPLPLPCSLTIFLSPSSFPGCQAPVALPSLASSWHRSSRPRECVRPGGRVRVHVQGRRWEPACLSSSRRSRPGPPALCVPRGPCPPGRAVLVSSCISLFSPLSLCPSSDLDRDFWNNNESTVQQKWSSYPPKEFILNISPYAPYGDPRLSLK